jgi:hypothetical protein
VRRKRELSLTGIFAGRILVTKTACGKVNLQESVAETDGGKALY